MNYLKKYLSVAALLCLVCDITVYADVVPQVHRDIHHDLQQQLEVMSYFTTMIDSVETLEGVEPWDPYASLDVYGEMNEDFAPTLDFDKEPLKDVYDINMNGWYAPIKGRINSPFGWRRRRMHKGTDIKLFTGDTVRAAFDGVVRIRRFQRRGYGYYYVIRHNNGLETIYGHLSRQIVEQGQHVKAGQAIGLGGSTGRSTGPHLHFEMRLLGIPLDPAALIDFETFEPRDSVYHVNRRQAELAAGGNRAARQRMLAGNSGGSSTNNGYQRNQGNTNNRNNTASNKKNKNNSNNNNNKKAQANNGGKSNGSSYTIRKGDTLGSIARRNGTTVNRLCRLNGLTPNQTLWQGQKLRLR